MDVRQLLSLVARQVRSASLAAGSVTAYERGVGLWLDWCQHHAPPHRHDRPLHRDSGVHQLDQCVCMYLASVYLRGDGRLRQLGVSTVYGLYYHHPPIRGRLSYSEQFLTGWSRLRPSTSHPPLTWPLVTLIAVGMALEGYAGGALATLVSFDALLRVSEMAALRVEDVSPPLDHRRGRISSVAGGGAVPPSTAHVVLRLGVTKTGSNQWVTMTNPQVESLLLRYITGRHRNELVFNLALPGQHFGGQRQYRNAFRLCCRGLRLDHLRFTPHSLRHGGATHALQHLDQTIETVMLRGRWQSVSSCRIYLQAGRAQLLQQIIDPSIVSLSEQVVNDWYGVVHQRLGLQRR